MSLRKKVELGLIVIGLAGILGSFSLVKHNSKLIKQIPPNISQQISRVYDVEEKLNNPILGKDISPETFENYRKLQQEYKDIMSREGFSELREQYERYTQNEIYGIWGILPSGLCMSIGLTSILDRKMKKRKDIKVY